MNWQSSLNNSNYGKKFEKSVINGKQKAEQKTIKIKCASSISSALPNNQEQQARERAKPTRLQTSKTVKAESLATKIKNCTIPHYNMNGRVAQRITRLTTDQKIAGSNPAVLELTLFTTVFILNLYAKLVVTFSFTYQK